jgi:hypothetical protein
MQVARPRTGASISATAHRLATLTHLLSLPIHHSVGETADGAEDVDEEMMGVAWLLALQAHSAQDVAFARQLLPKLVPGHATNHLFLSDDLQVWVALPDTRRLRRLAQTLHMRTANILWARRPDGAPRLSVADAFANCRA